MDFDTAFPLVVKVEAGLTLDPVDRGNWTGGRQGVGTLKGTKYGISAASYPDEDIANMTPERARQLFKRDYWDAAGCELVPDTLRYEMFDMAINSGVLAAKKALQTAARVSADGVIGAQTRAAINGMDAERLEKRFDGARLFHVTEMDSERWQRFGRGLVIRIANTMLANA